MEVWIAVVLIAAGFYVGWNIGANDAANCIGTTVGAGIIGFRRAAILMGIFVTLGGVLQGHHVMKTVGKGIVITTPAVYEEVHGEPPPPEMEEYHFTVDMTNQAIGWVKAQQSMTPDKPFFVYYATGAVHAPHHVPKRWADKYKGRFDKGWDAIREESIARQKKMGLVPEDTTLGPKPVDIKDWAELDADKRRLFTRQAEVFAGFLEQTDHEIGRLEPGLKADLIVIDFDAPHLTPCYDPFSHLVYAARASDVRDTMVNGEFRVRNRQLVGVGIEKILEEARACASEVRAGFGES